MTQSTSPVASSRSEDTAASSIDHVAEGHRDGHGSVCPCRLCRAGGRALLVAVLLLASSGCGRQSELVDVQGRILMNGEPLPGALVIFTPVGEGSSSFGYTDSNGEYRLRSAGGRLGALPGRHRVRITRAAKIDVEHVYPENIDPDRLSELDRVRLRQDKDEPIPSKYNTDSTLVASLGPDYRSEQSFELVE